jgi:hypothetical protein
MTHPSFVFGKGLLYSGVSTYLYTPEYCETQSVCAGLIIIFVVTFVWFVTIDVQHTNTFTLSAITDKYKLL